jgi:hypothetical protein
MSKNGEFLASRMPCRKTGKPIPRGVEMNNWSQDYMAEYRRQDLIAEAEQIRLEKSADLNRNRFGPFGRIMAGIGNWMIEKGKQICKRYDTRSPAFSSTSFDNFKSRPDC